jgi:hypothetical protein
MSMEVSYSIAIAVAAGAAATLYATADQTLKDSYTALKRTIQSKCPTLNFDWIEANRIDWSEIRDDILAEYILNARIDQDAEILHLTQSLLEAIQRQGPEIPYNFVDLKKFEDALVTIWTVTGTVVGIKQRQDFRHPPLTLPGAGPGIVLRSIQDLIRWFCGDRNLIIRRTSRGKFNAAPPIARDPVDCTVFAPRSVALGEQALIQVFVHTPEQAEKIDVAVEKADPEARPRGATTLSTEIARNSRLTFTLEIPRLVIDEPVKEIIWRGREVSVQFSVTAPDSLAATFGRARQQVSTVATISVSQDGVVIGQIQFALPIEKTMEWTDYPQVTGEAIRYQTAFISYASENRPEVLQRVQMLPLVGISYFQDLLSLDPGQRWAQQLYHHIDSSDVFFLFWSTPAKQSKWVTKEWRYGLKQKGLDFIKPVMIEGPPPVPPPKALAKLHFNDWLLYVIRVEEAARGATADMQ